MKLKIACLQMAARDLKDARATLEHSLALIDEAAQRYQPDIIVTPECTYPAYVLGSVKEFLAAYPGDPLPQYTAKAREHNCHLVLGLATPGKSSDGADVVYNEAVLVAPDGKVIGRTAKHLMWHFDSKWFCPGSNFPVFDTALGRIGIMICADGRMPEIARSLTLAGAQIIIDPTAWVTYGTNPTTLTNQQAEYMLATRAYENGVPCVACDKVGMERGTVLYTGRSAIINAHGGKIAEGSSHNEEIVFGEVELPSRAFPAAPRRPALYHRLVEPTENQVIHELLKQPLVPAKAVLRGAVVQYAGFDSTEIMGETVRGLVNQLAREGANLAVLPDVPPGLAGEAAQRGSLVFPFYRSLSKLSGVALLATAIEDEGGRRFKTARLFHAGQELGQWRQTHFTAQDEGHWTPGDEIGGVVALPGSEARIGVMLGADGYVPEVARALMLQGADIILWPVRPVLPAADKSFDVVAIARTRAAENRLTVMLATPLENTSQLDSSGNIGRSAIVDGNGAVVAPCLPDIAMAASTQISIAASREKLRAPGTDVVYNRQPAAYHRLIEDAV